ncbi:transcription termination factor NusA [uncultured Pseudoramibacter sp.]|jgi:N utilization substance protein A|uniref:Transcription termination/antitermination protein NusA n=1 Tax=Candidatus Pseudoramibacter fermentans TaxID=2594427 RepID=A0A6L5GRF2_9FIRM|nr:transcription termination factor NusA [uncultured Pseudoramibacter sp.]MQM72807.1 transcription termination/antitermination protein NusA [Candidatus Pseudoramibacter fermentans]RRF93838.1 MAG: transcription termination/antitermination protein NusA [Eubacteriaceae bacterium]
MNAEFMAALDIIEKEKGINKEELIQDIESSIEQAYKKNYGNDQDFEVNFDRDTGEIKIFARWLVVDDDAPIGQSHSEKRFHDALKIDDSCQIGDVIEQEIEPKDFGRIAAQNAKQMIYQKIKEQERKKIYNEFIEHEDEVVVGTVDHVERKMIFVNLGDTIGFLPQNEQIPGENYHAGDRIKVYILSVRNQSKGPEIILSRKHPGLLKRLLEDEVPEIYDGIVEVESIAREAGARSKIAVKSNDPSIDPVGACVGHKGSRIQNIIDELGNEKIDVIKYSDNPYEYITNALSPANVKEVLINQETKQAYAIVDDFQFSLAIGKEGQNVRLAVHLTGWKIDIKSDSEFEKILSDNPNFREEFSKKDEHVEKLVDEIKKEMDALLDNTAGSGQLDLEDDNYSMELNSDDDRTE